MDIYGRLTSAGTGHDALYYTRLGVENAWSLVYGEDKGIVFNPPSPPVISAFAVWLGNYRAVFLEGDRIVRSTGATATVLDTSNAPTIAASNTALNAKLTTAIGAAKNPDISTAATFAQTALAGLFGQQPAFEPPPGPFTVGDEPALQTLMTRAQKYTTFLGVL